ncbi:MAG: cytochrome c biogenesis protein CcsA [Burkholderiales bacterium]|nr:cytochrome c biogenesis protein CcsA [Burkholderiales bacterium]
MNAPLRWTTFAAPSRFFALASAATPWCWAVAAITGLAGLWMGFFVAPTDFQQGESYRIIFIHVPAAWMSMLLYLAIAFWSALGWGLNARMGSTLARAIAPTGAMFTAVALVSGALWGQPTWGTWWVWDARLTSELILLLLYLGYIALVEAIDDPRRSAQAGALLSLVGALNVPIIYFSVRWWNTLHQGASISLTAAPKMAQTMLQAMGLMTIAFWAFAFAVIFTRARALVLELESESDWVAERYRHTEES